jgi:hypothetical protein
VNTDTRLGPETMITRSDEPIAVEADRTVVMMSVEQGMYFGLEGVGGRVWSLLERPCSFGALCLRLVEEFKVDPDVCRREVGSFLHDLHRARLVRLHDPSADSVPPPAGS